MRTLEIIFVPHSDFIHEGVEPGSDAERPLQSFPIHHLPREFAGSACVVEEQEQAQVTLSP